jgi:hypothetical protein
MRYMRNWPDGPPGAGRRTFGGPRAARGGIVRILAACLLVLAGAGLAIAQDNPGAAQDKPAVQEKRVALVVGNSTYRIYQKLRNPVADAADMQVALLRLNFKLFVGQDRTVDEF